MNERLSNVAKAFVHEDDFMAWFDQQEASAVNKAVSAKPDDHMKRLEACADIRAIRALRSALTALSEGTANPTRIDAPV